MLNTILFFTCVEHRLSDFIVSVSDVAPPAQTRPLDEVFYPTCYRHAGHPGAGETITVYCDPAPIWGRYVYISLPVSDELALCEVQVYEGKHVEYSYTLMTPVLNFTYVNFGWLYCHVKFGSMKLSIFKINLERKITDCL